MRWGVRGKTSATTTTTKWDRKKNETKADSKSQCLQWKLKKNRGGYSVMKITQTSTLIHANVLHFLALCPESMPATQETQTVKV